MICDFHCHVIPAVDDGSDSIETSRRALREMHAQSITHIIASPHFDGELTHNTEKLAARLAEIDKGWQLLENLVRTEFPALSIGRGVELMLNTPNPVVDDHRLRLNGTRFMLVEFPGMTIPPNALNSLEQLRRKRIVPILAHPERYPGIENRIPAVVSWLQAGVKLQVNYSSLLGAYGSAAKNAAAFLLKHGYVSYLASDYHSRGAPAIPATRRLFERAGNIRAFEQLSQTNPMKLFADIVPDSVPPIPKLFSLRNDLAALLPARWRPKS